MSLKTKYDEYIDNDKNTYIINVKSEVLVQLVNSVTPGNETIH
jgi:hypothetical protein